MMKPGGCSNNVIRLRTGGTSLPCDSENHPHTDGFAPEGFEPIEAFRESFVSDADRFRDEDERGVDKPLPIIASLLAGAAIWSLAAFGWWWA